MKFIISAVLLSLTLCLAVHAQTAATPETAPAATEKKARKPVFRANKEQAAQAQTFLKAKGLYTGEVTGKLNPDTRAALKAWQKENAIKETGTLNRVTLEKMGIELTDRQKGITAEKAPDGKSVAKASSDDDGAKPKRVIFRATKEQITEAQKMLKAKAMFSGEESGKLDDGTRDGLRKFQEANGLKVTGTLNQVTLEKMGIALTDRQKEIAAQK
jgi:peptidoglycan hydrolase-like protein with peptidoglycan-binding domain